MAAESPAQFGIRPCALALPTSYLLKLGGRYPRQEAQRDQAGRPQAQNDVLGRTILHHLQSKNHSGLSGPAAGRAAFRAFCLAHLPHACGLQAGLRSAKVSYNLVKQDGGRASRHGYPRHAGLRHAGHWAPASKCDVLLPCADPAELMHTNLEQHPHNTLTGVPAPKWMLHGALRCFWVA